MEGTALGTGSLGSSSSSPVRLCFPRAMSTGSGSRDLHASATRSAGGRPGGPQESLGPELGDTSPVYDQPPTPPHFNITTIFHPGAEIVQKMGLL